MASFSQKDINLLFIGAAATKTTTTIEAMNDGEIGIFTPAGVRVTEATAATVKKFIIVKKVAGGIPLVSGIINKADLKSVTRKVYVAATDQVQNIGYDGSTGSITVTNDNEYHVRISFREGLTSNHGGLYLKHGFYVSDLNATQYEIAANLVSSIQDNFSKEAEKLISVQMLANDAGVATTGTVDVVKGTRKAVASVPGDFEVGGLLRTGTATTAAVYKIVSISGNVLTLDSKMVAATGQYAIAAAESVTAALAAAASYGIKLTGIPSAHVVGKLHGDLAPIAFDVTLEGFGATANVLTTAATAGNGTEKQIKELEFFCQGNEGDFYRIGEPNLFPKRTEASGNYDLISLDIQENYTGSIVLGPIFKSYTLALPTTAPNYAIAATADDITDVLEVLAFASATGALAIT